MAKLEYNEIKPRKYIVYDNAPYEVLEYHVARTQQRKPQNQVKMRNLLNGKVIPATFHASDTVDEADISRKEIKYLYTNKGEAWFCEAKNPSNRFILSDDVIGSQKKFLKENSTVDAKIFTNDDDDEITIGIDLPIKLTFKVVSAPPNIKGNTAGSSSGKLVTIETGAAVTAPLFIEEGDEIIVNTESGEYVERAGK
jgi:elongation factor P